MSHWHSTYEPVRTSKIFPHSSVFRHWARVEGDTRRLPDIPGVHDPLIITLAHRLRRLHAPTHRYWWVSRTLRGWSVALYSEGTRPLYTLHNLTRSRMEEAVTVLRALGEIVDREDTR